MPEWEHPDCAKSQANFQFQQSGKWIEVVDCLITESMFLDMFCLIILHYNTANQFICFHECSEKRKTY